jgi:catechol 2,3-dioxygenase-like lactoylglutathione lyase family enzyme
LLTGIDHVIVAVADLERATEAVGDDTGMRVVDGGSHPGSGTRNRLVWWGDSYLELVAVEDTGVAAGQWFGAAVVAALGRADVPAGAPVGLALASDDLAGDAASMGLAEVTEGQRIRPDGRVVRWRVARPRAARVPESAAAWPLLFVIEHERTAAEWTEAEVASRASEIHLLGTTVRLRSATLAVPSVPAAVGRLGREFRLAFRPSLAGGGARDASVGDQTLRLVAARGAEPLMTINLRGGHQVRQVDQLGCRWRLAPVLDDQR